jgi:hypothetical protein
MRKEEEESSSKNTNFSCVHKTKTENVERIVGYYLDIGKARQG